MARPNTAPTSSLAFEAFHGFLPPSAFPMTPPSKMAKPTVKPINSYAVSVSWVPPADFAAQRGARTRAKTTDVIGNKLVCGFQLRFRTMNVQDGDDLSTHINVGDIWPPEAHQACLKWLKGGLTYFFEVRAFNDAGDGDWSDSGEPFLMPRVTSSMGQSLSRSLEEPEEIRPMGLSSESDSIDITWKRPCDRGARIINYDLLCCKDPKFAEGTTKQLRVEGNECRAIVRGLEPNTTYFFKYRAINEVGSSAWSASTPGIATKARPPQAPDPPSQLESGENAGRATEVTIKWEPPESFGIPIQHYSVRTSTHPDMKDAVEILIGDRGAGSASGQENMDSFQDSTVTGESLPSSSLPSSPVRGRPGFNKGKYALTQLRVKGLNPMTEYYFQVKAANQIGESAWSRPSPPTLTAASPPGRCGQVRYLEGGQRHFRVCWSRPDSYGLPITSYDVRFSRMVMMNDGVQSFSTVMAKSCQEPGAAPDDMEALLSGRWAAGIEFFCQVRAWNRAGSGNWSPVSDGMMVAPERPSMPEAPARFTSLPRAIVVHWDAKVCMGAPVTGYRLRFDTSREMKSPVEVIGVKGTITEFAVTGLAPHHSYHFQLACVNSVGCSEWSPASRPVQVLQLPPVKMSSPFLVNQSQTEITIGFTPPVDCGTHDGQLIQSYTMRYSESRERLVAMFGERFDHLADAEVELSRPRLWTEPGEQLDHLQDAPVQTIRDARPEGVTGSNLKPGRTYYFQVFAVNEFGEGEPSEVTEICTFSAAPAPPFPPALVEYTPYTMVLAMQPDEDSGAPITHYTLKVMESGTQNSWIIEPFEAYMLECEDKQHYCVDSLKPGTSYRVQCGAVNGRGRSAWSKQSQEYTTKPTPPGVISHLDMQVLDVTMSTFRLLWSAPVDNGSPITEYTVSRCTTGKFEITSSLHREERCTTTDFLLTECAPGSTVYVKVSAHNALGRGELSKATEVTMHVGPPFPVGKPVVKDVTSHSVRLMWAVPYDGGDQVKRFWVTWTETDTDGAKESEKDSGEMMINGLKRQTNVLRLQALREYIFKIAAENSVGVSKYGEYTDPVRLLPPEAPGPPGQPAFISATMTMLTCHWANAEPNGSPLLDQVVRISRDPSMPEDKCIDIVLSPSGIRPYKPKAKSPNKNRTLKSIAYDNFQAKEASQGGKNVGGNSISVTSPPYGSLGKVDLGSTATTDASVDGWSLKLDETLTSAQGFSGAATWSGPETKTSKCSEAVAAQTLGHKDKGFMSAVYNSHRGRNTLDYEFEVPGLKGGQDYYLKVAARNKVGLGEFSPVSEMMSTLKGPPLSIITLNFVERCPASLTLQWDIPDFQGSPILRYQIICAAVDVQAPGVETDTVVHEYELLPQDIEDPEKPCCCMDGLSPGVSYSAMVCSTNDYGTAPWVTVEAPESTEAMVPSKMQPPEPIIAERTQASVTFRWTLPAPRGSPLIAIELRHMSASIEECTTDSLDVGELGEQTIFYPDPETGEFPTKHKISGFLPGTMVALVARGINAVGPGDWSDRPGLIGREKRNLVNRGESAHAIIEGDDRVMEKDLLPQRPGSAPYGSAKQEEGEDHSQRVRALDLFLQYTTQPTMPSAPEAPVFDLSMMTPYSGVIDFKVGKMNGLVYTEFGFRLFAGKPGEDFEMLEGKLGEDEQALVREFKTSVSYEENSGILSREYMRTRWILDLKPGTVYALQAYTANELGSSEWSSTGPPARTHPDRPLMTRAILSEFTSPSHIQLRWGPPYNNGSAIQGYDIRYNAQAEFLPLAKWTKIPQDDLEKNWMQHEADDTARTYEVHGLEGGIPHFFVFRARNEVGYSDWSEVSRFVTKPSRPAKIDKPAIAENGAKPTELVIEWREPDYHGAPITRYECLASMKKTIVAWCRVAGEKLFNTNDLDRLFGTAKLAEEELADEAGRYEVGHEAMGQLDCDEAFYTFEAPTPGFCKCQMNGLLPGKEYYFMVRGISDAGKGNWSNIAGPLRTDKFAPAKPIPMKVESTSSSSAVFSFILPYDNGLPIESASLVVRRRQGPVAEHEIHPETGEVHEDVANKWQDFDPLKFNTVEVDGFLPGSEHEVSWACKNPCGIAFWSDPTVFNTLAGLPDIPGDIILPDE